jgi:hypothetical protein
VTVPPPLPPDPPARSWPEFFRQLEVQGFWHVALDARDGARAAANLQRWLATQGEPVTLAPDGLTIRCDGVVQPSYRLVTVDLGDGRVATALLEGGHNYLAEDEVWPWSWR